MLLELVHGSQTHASCLESGTEGWGVTLTLHEPLVHPQTKEGPRATPRWLNPRALADTRTQLLWGPAGPWPLT